MPQLRRFRARVRRHRHVEPGQLRHQAVLPERRRRSWVVRVAAAGAGDRGEATSTTRPAAAAPTCSASAPAARSAARPRSTRACGATTCCIDVDYDTHRPGGAVQPDGHRSSVEQRPAQRAAHRDVPQPDDGARAPRTTPSTWSMPARAWCSSIATASTRPASAVPAPGRDRHAWRPGRGTCRPARSTSRSMPAAARAPSPSPTPARWTSPALRPLLETGAARRSAACRRRTPSGALHRRRHRQADRPRHGGLAVPAAVPGRPRRHDVRSRRRTLADRRPGAGGSG